MQFSVTTTEKNGILQACERYTRLGDATITGTTAYLAEFTNYCNEVQRELLPIIFRAYGGWQYDDSNQTYPAATAQTLTSGTANYTLPTGSYTVKGVEVKDTNGNWTAVAPITEEQIRSGISQAPASGQLYAVNNGSIGNFLTTPGRPIYFLLQGNTVTLYPTPNYTQASSLKVFFDRGSVSFVTTDTTKTPGFIAEFHDLIPLGAACRWFQINSPEDLTYQVLKPEYELKKKALEEFYSSQGKRLFKQGLRPAVIRDR